MSQLIKKDVEVVRKSITALTQILAEKKIRVTQQGEDAFVESNGEGIPVRINIPYIPDNISEALLAAINGFLDHEVAHVLYTDFKATAHHKIPPRGGVFQLYNVLEDARIELLMQKRFKGSQTNLRQVGNFVLNKVWGPAFEKAMENGGAEDQVFSALLGPMLRALAGQELFINFMSDKWQHLERIDDLIEPLKPKIARMASTSDACEVAKELAEILKKKPEDGDKEESGEGEKSKKSKPKSKSPKDDKPKDKSKGKTEEGKEGGKDEESENADGESAEDEEEKSGDGLGEDGEDGDAGEEPDEDGDYGEESESVRGEMDSLLDKIESGDFMKEFAGSIKEMCKDEARYSDYRIYTTDYDKVIPFKTKDVSGLAEFEREIAEVSGVLRLTLERLIKAKSVSRKIAGKTRGKINPSSLYRLKTGDVSVFSQKEEQVTNDVDVSLVVDCSGSMRHDDKINGKWVTRITVAMQAAYAMCDVLERLKINCEVIGFTTNDSFITGARPPTHGYSRTEPLYFPLFKAFGENFSLPQKQRMFEVQSKERIYERILRNNVDGESVRVAAKRLIMLGKSKKKTMIVFSDGLPEAEGDRVDQCRDLKLAVKEISKSGINLIGIGIGDSNVSKYYPKHAVVNNIGELPNVLLKTLSETLLK